MEFIAGAFVAAFVMLLIGLVVGVLAILEFVRIW